MSKTKLCSGICILAFLLMITPVHAYDVILKNGKTIKGDLVSKDETMIVLKDASGIKIQLKTSNVDLEKTEAANPKSATPASDAAKSQKSESAPPPKPTLADVAHKSGASSTGAKKPARVYTQDDAERLRDQNDLGEGTYDPNAPEATPDAGSDNNSDPALDISGKSEQQYRSKAQALRDKIQRAQDAYNTLSSKCSEFKGASIQTHVAVDENGNPIPLKETSDKICADADQAKSLLDGAQQDLNSFLEEARQAGIPPGWVGQN